MQLDDPRIDTPEAARPAAPTTPPRPIAASRLILQSDATRSTLALAGRISCQLRPRADSVASRSGLLAHLGGAR